MSRSSSLLRHREVVLGPAVLDEQLLGDAVDVHVGRLRREHHRDEQLERALERERDLRVGVLDGEPLDHRPDPLLLRRRPACAAPRDVAPRHLGTATRDRAPRGGHAPPPSRGPAQTRSSAGQPEHVNSLGVGTNSPALMRAIAADSSLSSSGSSRRSNVVETTASGPLEEVVDDLDLVGAGAEARERVDEPLQPVVGLDDLLRRSLGERVRLVVEDERARAVAPEHVEAAVQEHAVVLERERPLGLRVRRASRSAPRAPTRSTRRRTPRSARAPRRSPPGTSCARSRRRATPARARSTSSSRRCTASPISVAFSPPSRPAPCRAPRAARRRARRSSGTSSARRARAPSTRAAAPGAAARRGSGTSSGSR